jgi:hypothetical protein
MTENPERIYGWLDTQLSIARFYGGINFNGHKYVIDMEDPLQPLVRQETISKKKKIEKKPIESLEITKDLWWQE